MPTLKLQLRSELRPMLALALPVVLGELGWMAMGVVDMVVVGRLGPPAIGAVSLGRALLMTIGVVGVGLLLGLDTFVSQAFGAKRPDECRRWLIHGVVLAVALSVPTTLFLLWLAVGFDRWDMDPQVRLLSREYLLAVSWSVLPLLLYTAGRRYLQATNLVRPVMLALVSANIVNAAGDWLLVFGHWGFPRMGVAGAGWATVLSMIYLMLFMAAAVLLHDREQGSPLLRNRVALEAARFRRLVQLGAPAAVQLGLEVGVFALAAVLAAFVEATALAAHQIALTLASVTFMVPFGISSAAAVRVGQALGRNDAQAAGRAGWVAIGLAATFMLSAAAAFILAPRWLLRPFTDDPKVLSIGVSLLAVAAVFQFFDGLQAAATGALRGAGDTRNPMLLSLVGYWLLGLPVGAWLCFRAGWGVLGLWVGLSVGLIICGIALAGVWSRCARQLPHKLIGGAATL